MLVYVFFSWVGQISQRGILQTPDHKTGYKTSVLRAELEKDPGGFTIQYVKVHLFPLVLFKLYALTCASN